MSTSLTLYSLNAELAELEELLRDLDPDEDRAPVEAAIAGYKAALPQKVDSYAHVIAHMEHQIQLAVEEVARLNARRRAIASAKERLENIAIDVLKAQPQPKKGCKRLEGQTSALVLRKSGGLQSLNINNEALIPEEYCNVTLTIGDLSLDGASDAIALLRDRFPDIQRSAKISTEPDSEKIRAALAENCWECSGTGKGMEACPLCKGKGRAIAVDAVEIKTDGTVSSTNPRDAQCICCEGSGKTEGKCPHCGGTGKNGVIGCTLGERKFRLEVE